MPYEKKGKCVYKQGSKKALKCFKTDEEALKYLRALVINVTDASKVEGVLNRFNWMPEIPENTQG